MSALLNVLELVCGHLKFGKNHFPVLLWDLFFYVIFDSFVNAVKNERICT